VSGGGAHLHIYRTACSKLYSKYAILVIKDMFLSDKITNYRDFNSC